MTVFKCKMCGGALEITENQSTVVCEYCGTNQTLPKLDDERRVNLYDRANHFRRSNEYDKAMAIYEQILNENPTDAECYWSLVLCCYGIEYVEDPVSHKRVPTVNRAQFTSIFDDSNYKAALAYSDIYQKSIYEAEANAINEIQKGILQISQKEEPFDVFICYKETDNNDRRTQDSVLANDLYHQLTQEGFKVFFSRITLEDKLGSAYEPYIFAALNSAKVMVVLGTKPEYFKAVWVKNEWSRYLSLIKESAGKKVLIPAYKDMDPYDLPDEFSHLQAQDMSKLGFMQDLIRGIKKLTQSEAAQTIVNETAISGGVGGDVASLLKRVFIFLEDKDWKSADEYCEKVLDIDPECAEAYLGKLMAEVKCSFQEELKNCAQPFDKILHYQKIQRYGSSELKEKISADIRFIKERNENVRLNDAYVEAIRCMNNAVNEVDYKRAAEIFSKIQEFKDSEVQKEKCLELANESIYQRAMTMMRASKNEKDYREAAKVFQNVIDYKNSVDRREECLRLADGLRREYVYKTAIDLKELNTKESLKKAIKKFETILGWEDVEQQILYCKKRINEIEEFERNQELLIERLGKENKRNLIILALLIIALVLGYKMYSSSENYKQANYLYEDGCYTESISGYLKGDKYKNIEGKVEVACLEFLENVTLDAFCSYEQE